MRWAILDLLFGALLSMLHGVVLAQGQSAVPPVVPPPAASVPAAEVTTAPQAIAASSIALQAESALTQIRQIENRNRIADAIETAGDRIPLIERETNYRLREVRRLVGSAFSFEAVQSLEEESRAIGLRITPIRRELTQAALQTERDIKELETLESVWTATVNAASESDVPREVLNRAKEVIRVAAAAKSDVVKDRAKLLALQGKATDIGTRLGEMQQLLTVANERAVTRLLYKDGPAVWSDLFWAESLHLFSSEAREHLENQASGLIDYFRSHQSEFGLHALVAICLALLLVAARSRVDVLSRSDEALKSNRQIFDMPLVTALLIAVLLSGWIYPRPPRALWLMIGVLASGPLLAMARRVTASSVYPVLNTTVIFFLVDRLRMLFAPLPGVHRILLLLEVLAFMLFVLTTLRRQLPVTQASSPEQGFTWKVIRYAGWIGLVLAVVIMSCAAAGYARLADLLMRAMLSSAYTAVALYVLTHAGEGLVHGLLYVPPISFFAGIRRHRATIAGRINFWTRWGAFLLWIALTLRAPGLWQRLAGWGRTLWKATLEIGNLKLPVSDLLVFVFILWATYVISRLTRFLLEEEIFSRVRLDRGLPYAVSTTVRYIILLSGFVLALAALGVDMTKFTIVAGALTVGIGFGLQNIVNNFVSGLIVLFERPVKVGDTIQIDDIVGRVQHIGIRATVIHSIAGAEVIIPNGKLISDRVTNWTLSNQLRQIAVPVITKPDINVGHLKAILLDVARWNEQVLEEPAPEVLFIKRGVDAFEFELRVWTGDFDAWLRMKSDLITAINDALEKKDLPAQASSSGTSDGQIKRG